jgi:predicted nucleotidyltransferase
MSIFSEVQIRRPALDAGTEYSTRVFLQRLEGKFCVVGAILYGSRARGDHDSDSDIDLAIILEGEGGDRYKVAGRHVGRRLRRDAGNGDSYPGSASLGGRI